jgi:undecaprenyl-diphosphatase
VTEEAAQRAGRARQLTSGLASARRGSDLLVLCVSTSVLVVTMAAAHARVTSLEVEIFRAVNELPQGLHTGVWLFMQYGTFITIPTLALVALLFRRVRLAFAMALAGVGVYLLVLLVKEVVERRRPGDLLAGVEERESFGAESLGYPSGHAAVAAALTVVVAAHLPKRWLFVALALGAIVLVGRIYVGAHLPLDVVGGAALGAIAGSIVNLMLRADRASPTID